MSENSRGPRIFLSYRREDSSPYARLIAEHLRAHFGQDSIFMDVDTLSPGDNFVEAIASAVSHCDAFVAVIGRQWLTATGRNGESRLQDPTDFVRMEVSAALERKVLVIPILVGGAQMPRASELPEALLGLLQRNALGISDTDFTRGASLLVQSLDRALPPRQQAEPAKAPLPFGGRKVFLAIGIAGAVLLLAVYITWISSRGMVSEPLAQNTFIAVPVGDLIAPSADRSDHAMRSPFAEAVRSLPDLRPNPTVKEFSRILMETVFVNSGGKTTVHVANSINGDEKVWPTSGKLVFFVMDCNGSTNRDAYILYKSLKVTPAELPLYSDGYGNSTRRDILREMVVKVGHVHEPEDTIMIYLAGTGPVDQRALQLSPYNVRLGCSGGDNATLADVQTFLAQLSPRRVFLFVNTSYRN
jgi:hypothetical protein